MFINTYQWWIGAAKYHELRSHIELLQALRGDDEGHVQDGVGPDDALRLGAGVENGHHLIHVLGQQLIASGEVRVILELDVVLVWVS